MVDVHVGVLTARRDLGRNKRTFGMTSSPHLRLCLGSQRRTYRPRRRVDIP